MTQFLRNYDNWVALTEKKNIHLVFGDVYGENHEHLDEFITQIDSHKLWYDVVDPNTLPDEVLRELCLQCPCLLYQKVDRLECIPSNDEVERLFPLFFNKVITHEFDEARELMQELHAVILSIFVEEAGLGYMLNPSIKSANKT